MKNFIAGLIVGIIVTTCFFIFYPSVKTDASSLTPVLKPTTDTPQIKQPTDSSTPTAIRQNNLSSAPGRRDSIVAFAKTQIGVPYLYGSTDPAKGFDCSGFINFVFNHFKIPVPRSSFEFDKIGTKTTLDQCLPGDLILFTGTSPEEKNIGHIGIIVDTAGAHPTFIHSSSGKANGVTITSLESTYYQGRFVAVVDVLGK